MKIWILQLRKRSPQTLLVRNLNWSYYLFKIVLERQSKQTKYINTIYMSQRLRVRFVPDSNIGSTLFRWSRAVLALTKHLGTVHQLVSADQSLLDVAQ